MKLKFYYIIISLFFSNVLLAEITKPEYDALIDQINCEYGEFLIQDANTNKYYDAYKQAISDCDFVNMIEFYKSEKPFLEKNGEIAYIINDLKIQYRVDTTGKLYGSQEALYDSTVQLFTNTSLLRHVYTLSNEAEYKKLESRLDKEIKEQILGQHDVEIEEDAEESGNIFDILTHPYILWFIVIVILLCLALALWKVFQKFNNEESPIQPMARLSIPKKERKPEKVIHIKNEKPRKKREVKHTRSTKIEEDLKSNRVPQFIQDLQDKKKLGEKETFYMPPPSVSGSFYSFGRINEFKEDQVMFKFELVSKKYQICQFFVVNDPNVVTQGMMDFEKYLHPACDSENEPFPAATQIVTVQPGVVKRSTNHWRVQQKALIKFV